MGKALISLLWVVALVLALPGNATGSTGAFTDLLPLAALVPAASTPVSPGCAERSPSSASASPALGETDGAQRALAREHRRVGASNDWQYTYAGTPHAPTQIGQKAFLYDPSGNQIAADDLTSGKIRTAKWDEENRLQTARPASTPPSARARSRRTPKATPGAG